MRKEMIFVMLGVLAVGVIGFYWYQSATTEPSVPPAPTPVPAPVSGTNNQPVSTPTPASAPVSGANNTPNVIVVTVPAPPMLATVEIVNYQYAPKTLTVKVGTKVTWTNRDKAPHTVTVTGSNGGPESTLFGQNETYTYTFDKVGTYDYYCKPHPYMKGTVVVTN